MRIVHICISAPYIDDWGYQENLLPEYLSKHNTDNFVIGCSNVFPDYLSSKEVETIINKGDKYSIRNVKVVRIPAKKLTTTFVVPYGLKKTLLELQPDVIFHHGINCTSLIVASRYCKKHGCKLFVDNHADEYNISSNRLWNFFYHKFLIKLSLKYVSQIVKRYYGVTHGRCDFMKHYYGISDDKIGFLPIGADTNASEDLPDKFTLREKYGYKHSDFIVVSGGKMGIGKGTDLLINTISKINEEKLFVKLVLFGRFEDTTTESLSSKYEYIHTYGWCNRQKTLELLKISDLACWPVHHTTLIEDAVSVGTPIILKKTPTTLHLIDNNGYWIDNNLSSIIQDYFSCSTTRDQMRIHAQNKKNELSYNFIAQKVLDDINQL